MTDFDLEKPRLVESGQGFRFLNVEYKKRFLYSKYDPYRNVKTLIDNLNILEGSLLVISSPGLFYGIEELLDKIPPDTYLIAFEADPELAAVSSSSELYKKHRDIPLFTWNDLNILDDYVRNLCHKGHVRRALSIEFSAGLSYCREKYSRLMSGLTDIIGGFWKNRVTLVKMGRMYSRNVFRNLSLRKSSPLLDDVRASVKKDILVIGAGESLDSFEYWDQVKKGSFYVIAVDAALIPLRERGIVCDALVSLECQSLIDSFYVGVEGLDKSVLFADLCSRNEVCSRFKNRVFFLSQYSPGPFLDSLVENKIAASFIPPLGSVGLAAVYIALKLRFNEDVKVFTLGLDFSYSPGLTHSKNAPAHIARLASSDRKKTVENYEAVFSTASFFAPDKSGKNVCTTKVLSLYASQFKNEFRGIKNLYDAGKSGLDLGLPPADKILIEESIKKSRTNEGVINEKALQGSCPFVSDFLRKEKEELEEACDLLSRGEESLYRKKDLSLDVQLKMLLEKKDYLYLHFPDGFEYSGDVQFLKRVKAEILYFLKQCKISIQNSV
ncbi:6-hydroxymethylpterin diphosphokinase MptE-like protein [Treponema sp.]|uniref:6-hydroxymethylpterin diphosphokinase MptE-like protein n=1 Tax=Treponema sp. TaxID=166 RepID=UPI0025FD4206|nr:6-hydroxymethylpterin diphosphokinase MptE-like protein [Treponema sp.]MCR5218284.1 DUF115 domain-containing protein [Treponema sp.]